MSVSCRGAVSNLEIPAQAIARSGEVRQLSWVYYRQWLRCSCGNAGMNYEIIAAYIDWLMQITARAGGNRFTTSLGIIGSEHVERVVIPSSYAARTQVQ